MHCRVVVLCRPCRRQEFACMTVGVRCSAGLHAPLGCAGKPAWCYGCRGVRVAGQVVAPLGGRPR